MSMATIPYNLWSCKIGKVGSQTFSAPETASPGIGASVSHLHMGSIHWESSGPLYVEPFQAWQYYFWCRGSRLMMNTPLMDEQEFCMPFPSILDFWTLCFSWGSQGTNLPSKLYSDCGRLRIGCCWFPCPRACNRFQYLAMQQVLAWDWSSRSCNVYYNTFTWIKLHIPDQLP